MSERFAVHLDDLIEDPESMGFAGIFDEPEGGWMHPIITRSGLAICRQGRTIVANGCFDLPHPGHLSLFGWLDTVAYRERLRPILAINSDESVRRLKGPERPKWNQLARAAYLTHMKWPFTVIIFDEDTPQRLMDLLKPAIVVKGSEYPKESVVRWKDSEVMTVPMFENWSTSRMLGDTR